MESKYEKPQILIINIDEFTVLLRCACSGDDDNPW